MITKNVNGQDISQAFIDEIRSDSPNIIVRFWYNNAELACDIVEVVVEKGSCGEETFTIGSIVGDVLTASVKNLNTNIKGEVLEFHVGALVGESYEYVSLGKFTVSEARKTRYETKITAYSSVIANTGKKFLAGAVQDPMLSTIGARVGTDMGATITFDESINTSLRLDTQLSGLTNYQVLQMLAVCSGGYAINTNDGNVVIKQFSTVPNLVVNTGMMTKLPEIEERGCYIKSVGVVVSEETMDDEGNIVPEVMYSYMTNNLVDGNDVRFITHEGVFLMATASTENMDISLKATFMTRDIFNYNVIPIVGYSYYPADVRLTLGDPRIEGSDVLSVVDVDGTAYPVPCHKVIHTFNGGFTTEIISAKSTNMEDSIGTTTRLTDIITILERKTGTAQASAENVRRLANDTMQYFWMTEEGFDTGAHITEIPQETFKQHPAGYNLLARSNGVAIREALIELARFTGSNVEFLQDSNVMSSFSADSVDFYNSEGEPRLTVTSNNLTFYDDDGEIYADFGEGAVTDVTSRIKWLKEGSDEGGGYILKTYYYDLDEAPSANFRVNVYFQTETSIIDDNHDFTNGVASTQSRADCYEVQYDGDKRLTFIPATTIADEYLTMAPSIPRKQVDAGEDTKLEQTFPPIAFNQRVSIVTGTPSYGRRSRIVYGGQASTGTFSYTNLAGVDKTDGTFRYIPATRPGDMDKVVFDTNGEGFGKYFVLSFSTKPGWSSAQPYYRAGLKVSGNDSFIQIDKRGNGPYYSFGARATGHQRGAFSMTLGRELIAPHFAQFVCGEFNADEQSKVFIVGNGDSDTNRSNALTLDWSGNLTISGTYYPTSDRRLKEHIAYLGEDAEEFIRNLKPAHYIKNGEHHTGFYAQDVQEADKWESGMVGEHNGYLTLAYTDIIAPLVSYCQRLEKRIAELERRTDE